MYIARTLAAAALPLALALAPAITPAMAQTAAPSEMSAEERAALRAEVRAYLLEEPELILEAIQLLEERQKIAQEEEAKQALAAMADEVFNDDFSFVGGNPDGDLTLVEFLDYRCGYCKRAHSHVAGFLKADGGIRLVVKEFPVLGPDSQYAGRAAMASLKQEGGAKYKIFHDAMMEHRGQLDQNAVKQIARTAGLDLDQLEADMQAPDIASNMRSTFEIAEALSINGTPAFILGDRIIRGYVPQEALMELAAEVRSERAESEKTSN